MVYWYGANTISILIITKGHYSLKLSFNFCILYGHGLHLNQAQQKYSERFLSYGADMISILIITKGHYFGKIVRGVTILILCTLS